MLHSSRGVVLYQADYMETSLLIKVFTEQSGLQSYVVKGVRKKGARMKRNLFGPLSFIELIAYGKVQSGLQLVKDVSICKQFNHITSDITRSSVLLFMNELLYRSLRGEMPDRSLFYYIEESLEQLDDPETATGSFPLQFATRLTTFLGFEPMNNFTETDHCFDMQEGLFNSAIPLHSNYIALPLSRLWSEMLGMGPGFHPDAATRHQLLEKLLEYYRLHVHSFGEMKSHHILSTVLRDRAGESGTS